MKKSFLATVTLLFAAFGAATAQNAVDAPKKTTAEPVKAVAMPLKFANGETYLKSTPPAESKAVNTPKTEVPAEDKNKAAN
jgi:hypothetical protein